MNRPRYNLATMLLQIPEGEPICDEWDAMPLMGREIELAPVTLRSIRAMRRFLRTLKRNRRYHRIMPARNQSRWNSGGLT